MRELLADERAILEFLLSKLFPGRDELLAQLDRVVVTKEGPRDPTVGLEVEHSVPPAPGYEGWIGHLAEPGGVPDGVGHDADGIRVGVVIHTNDGYLSELEFYPDGGVEPYGRPTPDSMEFSDWQEVRLDKPTGPSWPLPPSGDNP